MSSGVDKTTVRLAIAKVATFFEKQTFLTNFLRDYMNPLLEYRHPA